MVDVLANIVQVVVFSSGADALLRVGSAAKLGHGVGRIDGVQEDWLELRENGNNGKSNAIKFVARRFSERVQIQRGVVPDSCQRWRKAAWDHPAGWWPTSGRTRVHSDGRSQ